MGIDYPEKLELGMLNSQADASTKTGGNPIFKWARTSDLDAALTDLIGQPRFGGGTLQGEYGGNGKADAQTLFKGTPNDLDVACC